MSATALGSVVLSEEQVLKIIDKAKQWALLHGVQMRPMGNASSMSQVEFAPITLFPSPVPRAVLQEAQGLQIHYNRLMHKVAHDHEFLHSALKNVIKVDDFTRMLWDMYMSVRNEGITQPICLGLFRNDFMMDVKGGEIAEDGTPTHIQIKQIEFNTIASSFAGLSSGIWNVHRYTMSSAGVKYYPEQLRENQPAKGLAKGLLRAWELYNVKSSVILVVSQDNERNSVDQKWVEKFVFELNPDVRVEFSPLLNIHQNGSLTDDKRLILDGTEVAVVYLRDGYAPHNYPTDKEWSARLMIERSLAIKCPSVYYQLAGCKKVQQELARPGTLQRFISDPAVVQRILKTFAGLYSLDLNEEGDVAVSLAMETPEKFVLKPQREGGGNNLYGEDIRTLLSQIKGSEERSGYILMERIFPWTQQNHLLKEGKDWRLQSVISELGIYGAYIGTPSDELHNTEEGPLLRTKTIDDNEGGIVAGFATMDTPFVVETT